MNPGYHACAPFGITLKTHDLHNSVAYSFDSVGCNRIMIKFFCWTVLKSLLKRSESNRRGRKHYAYHAYWWIITQMEMCDVVSVTLEPVIRKWTDGNQTGLPTASVYWHDSDRNYATVSKANTTAAGRHFHSSLFKNRMFVYEVRRIMNGRMCSGQWDLGHVWTFGSCDTIVLTGWLCLQTTMGPCWSVLLDLHLNSTQIFSSNSYQRCVLAINTKPKSGFSNAWLLFLLLSCPLAWWWLWGYTSNKVLWDSFWRMN